MNTPRQRDFSLGHRVPLDVDLFRRANPTATINVPITDHYQVLPDPAAPWHDTEQQPTDTMNQATGKAVTMSGETSITVIGNLTSDPELRFTPVSRGFRNIDGVFGSNPRTDVV